MFRLIALVLLMNMIVCSPRVIACNVPVFRYALERWQSDDYQLVIIHQKDLTKDQKTIAASIKASTRELGGSLNLRVLQYDLRNETNTPFHGIWKNYATDDQSPLAALLYSQNAREVPDRIVSVTPLADLDVSALIDSPARKALSRKILSGDSAVWIFVTSGDPKQDQEAYQRLEAQIEWNKLNLKLPQQDVLEADEFFNRDNPIELKLDFSIVRVDRNDPKESHLIAMLMGSESDLEELDQPMAFPVIGRGRVLYALVGKGIYKETIEIASKFVVGPCSCQVKDQNPGFDLLLDANWDSSIDGKPLSRPTPSKTKKPILIEIPTGK